MIINRASRRETGSPLGQKIMKVIVLVFVLLLLLGLGEKVAGKSDGGACGCIVGAIIILAWLLF